MKIHHVTLLTGNIPRTINFYTKILGFRMVKNSVNQENPTRRHVFFADYVGTPGTVTTFIEVPHLGPRYDDNSHIQNIDYYAPTGSEEFWQQRLNDFNIGNVIKDGTLHFEDFDEVPITLTFVDEKLSATQVNKLSNIPAEFQLLRIKNTNIFVPDIKQEMQFFADLNGTSITENKLSLEDGQTVSFLPTENDKIKRFGRGSFDHVALSAQNIDEIKKIRQNGEDKNYHFEKEIDRLYFYSVYFKDPFDNRIEWATLTPGFTIDEDLDKLGEKLGLPKRLESKRAELIKYFAEHDQVLFDE